MTKRAWSALMVGTCIVAVATPVRAQVQAQAGPRTYRIAAGNLKSALDAWARQSGRQVIYRTDDVATVRTAGAQGGMTADAALDAILARTGFTARTDSSGAVAIVGSTTDTVSLQPPSQEESFEDAETGAPEILVTGQNNWSLNTGIPRTEDDTQPFIVLTQEDIRKSGAPNLDTFLRNQLTVNAQGTTSSQTSANNGRTVVNLRGLGERETLVLVDGRRLPSVNDGSGSVSQPSLLGIPLAAIERIEVLASSASGLYGSGATGGVVNVIMRRDYRGVQATATFADTFAGGAGEQRFDLTGGTAIEDGRTNISFTASYRNNDPLFNRDRADLIGGYQARALANFPALFRFRAPAGALPNFVQAQGRPLTLDPAYGGGAFGSTFGTVPTGYRGVALDGVAPLLGGAGRFDFTPSDTGNGGRSTLVSQNRQIAGSLAVRREFNGWLKAYAEVSGNWTNAGTFLNAFNGNFLLPADAPNNPFEQAITITAPQVGADAFVSGRNSQIRGLAGAIIKLPGEWQALLDYTVGRNVVTAGRRPNTFDEATAAGLADGTLNLLRDTTSNPLAYSLLTSDFGAAYQSPRRTDLTTISARVAGPLPLYLPGGRPQLTLNVERSMETVGASVAAQNGLTYSQVQYVPARSQNIEAAYLELTVPLIGKANAIPFVEDLEVKVAVRHERYKGVGAVNFYDCIPPLDGPLPGDEAITNCPTPGLPIEEFTTRNSHSDPTVSMSWKPVRDVILRASYATGYLPPRLDDLVRIPQILYVDATDPARGGELIGALDENGLPLLAGFAGGSPDVRPESSKTLTAGIILQPRFVPGLRLSADWTRIRKKDNYFKPTEVTVIEGDPDRQATFEQFLTLFPERFVRAAPSDGYTVGRITSIDLSTANLAGSNTEAVDFSASYTRPLFGGTIELDSRATWVRDLSLATFVTVPVTDLTGVVTSAFLSGFEGQGSVRWKGNGSIRWSNDRFSIGWQTRYTDGYFVTESRAFNTLLGSDRVKSQTYHDVFGSYAFPRGFDLRAGVNNVFDTKPPFDSGSTTELYSKFGDPRLANFYLTLSKSF